MANPVQYSCLENSMDRGAWWAAVHGVAKSQTPLSARTHTHTHIHTHTSYMNTFFSVYIFKGLNQPCDFPELYVTVDISFYCINWEETTFCSQILNFFVASYSQRTQVHVIAIRQEK